MMDLATYDRLNHLLLKDGSLTVDQFRKLLSQELGAETPLVRQLGTWESNNYGPGQLLNLKSVLRDLVTTRTPSTSSIEDTMRFIKDEINGVKSLRDVFDDLFAAQRLHKWVLEYEEYYARATNTN